VSKFVVTDVFGNTVVGSFSAWDHVIQGHPEMVDQENIVKAAIVVPAAVYETSRKDRLLFRGETLSSGFWKGSFAKVAVNYRANHTGFLITAYLDTLEPRGKKRWSQP
jgi:hypothetical protein